MQRRPGVRGGVEEDDGGGEDQDELGEYCYEVAMAVTGKMEGAGGAVGERNGKWGNSRSSSKGMLLPCGCTWHSVWAILVAASMFLYAFAIFGKDCSPKEAAGGRARGANSQRAGMGMLQNAEGKQAAWSGDLRELETAWNQLCYGEKPPENLRIALFVKKWPAGGTPGGLERHAMTLHRVLAERGHDVHVFTISGDGGYPEDLHEGNLHIHFVKPNSAGGYQYSDAWELYVKANTSQPFDIVHSESVALPHWRARDVPNLAASWHGIAFEVIHSDIVHDLIRKPGEARSDELQKSLTERLSKVAEEVRFFPSYRHHVATSDYVGDVLRTIYEIPVQNVHTILNGVDRSKFHPNPVKGAQFRAKFGVPANASLVLGAAGRLVRDKGHPLLFEAFSEIVKEHKDVYLLIAGEGPWGDRYRELAPNAKTLGPMTPTQLAEFYNALDVFVNPTLRSQGLDHTLLEAMQCGKPLLATKFSSITWSVVISKDFGYTFSPNTESLIYALNEVIRDGKEMLRKKGEACLTYASIMFSATKMGAAYERLFLCMKNKKYCQYPLPHDCPPHSSKYFKV
ncbi:unnamed protein product [Calypogeia fissa]